MDEHKIGVYVCNCGTNIAKVVDCDAVVESASALPGVAVASRTSTCAPTPARR